MENLAPSLTDEEIAGQLLFIGVDGTVLDSDLGKRLEEIRPGGIILFGRNLQDAPQTAALCHGISRSLSIPPFLAIDQEGGRVSRLKGIFPPIPANLTLASSPAPDALVREHGHLTGRGLAMLGFNLNFAPVLDLSDADASNGIGDRAYGRDPRQVLRLAGAFLEAQLEGGVLGCGKHFPGLGSGQVDSHLELPRIERSADKIWTEDLAPYRALREDLPMVMVGHAHYPSLQGREPSPATLSRKVVHDLLRTGIPFSGLILTDDLEMGAVDQRRSPGDVALEALHAGNDLLMFCKSWERIVQAHGAIVRALATGTLSRSRVDESLARIRSLKTKLPVPAEASPFDPAGFTQVCRDLARLERATGA